MMAAAKGLADKPVLITPRTLLSIFGAVVFSTIAVYAWIFSTFVTVATFNAHAADFHNYVVGQDVRILKVQVTDANDKLWELERRIKEPGGNTQSNLDRKRDLKKRVVAKEKIITCIQTEGIHCLSNTDN